MSIINFLYLYITQNIITIFYFCIFLFLSSWLGIAFSDSFIESIFFVEILYLSLIIFASLISIITNHPLIDLFLIFIIFFTVCDSILGLILTLITFKTIKSIKIKHFIYLKN
jgi:NADH:ubiquinone oxidoreductase subunit K